VKLAITEFEPDEPPALVVALSESGTILRMPKPVGSRTTPLRSPSRNPSSTVLICGRRSAIDTGPTSPPLVALGSTDTLLASATKFSPFINRSSRFLAASSDSTTMMRKEIASDCGAGA
jgi:hypothetical protein